MPAQQGNANAIPIAEGIRTMGENIHRNLEQWQQMQMERERLRLSAMAKLEQLKGQSIEQRKALLADPQFMVGLVHDLFSVSNKKMTKEEMQAHIAVIQKAYGEETATEKAAREELEAKAGTAKAERQLKEQQVAISTGKEKATPLSLAIAGGIHDPIAAALFSTIPEKELKEIAENEKKTGPLYQQQQMQDWYKWGIGEGLQPGVAMVTALHISKGEWDQVPTTYTDYKSGKVVPIRGKAEIELANNTLQAQARMQEVQNNMENSIATSAAQLAEKAGLPLDQARADIIAMRKGKPAPYPTPHLAEMAKLDEINKQQEIEKNTQVILNDKAGIGVIQEALGKMMAEYKEFAGYGPTGELTGAFTNAQKADLVDKMNKLTEELSSRLAGRYGIQFKTYQELHPGFIAGVKGATRATIDTIAPPFAWSADQIKDFKAAIAPEITQPPGESLPVPPSGKVGPNVGKPISKHTPEQLQILDNISSSIAAAIANPNVPVEQKAAMVKYAKEVIQPAVEDPSKFMAIFSQPMTKPEDQQQEY